MIACCVGHTLLLAAGVGGIGTLIGAGTGNRILLLAATILFVAAVALVAVRVARRQRSSDQAKATRRG